MLADARPDAQEEDCRKLAARLGWQVVEVYEDDDVSAFNRRKARKHWLRLQDDIATGRVDAIIAAHTDRLYRRVRELEDLIDFVNDHGVAIKTVMAGDLDLTTSAGRAGCSPPRSRSAGRVRAAV